MSEITFQKMTVDDVEAFIKLEKKVVHMHVYSGMTDPKEVRKEIENNECYLIKKDGKIVGSMEYQMKGAGEAYFGGLVVDPDYRGQGIARKAAEFRLDKVNGVKRIWLVTHPHNNAVIRLYLSLGFIIESWKDNYYGDGEPRLVLAKES